MAKKMIVILGTTASGKTRLAVRLARELQGEIISADSRQVYKSLDIGTGKDLQEYIINGCKVPYHLIDIIDAREEFNLFEFQKRFYEIYSGLIAKNALPVMVGGTGLYLESIILNYQLPPAPPDQETRQNLQGKSIEDLQKDLLDLNVHQHNKTDMEDKDRLIRAIEIARARLRKSPDLIRKTAINAAVFGIRWERSVLRERITSRLKQRLKEGMIKEVEMLQKNGLSWARLNALGLEYRYVSQFLRGKSSYDEMFTRLNTSIHQFAKRQETWFRRMERKGINIHWINGDDYNLLKESVIKSLNE